MCLRSEASHLFRSLHGGGYVLCPDRQYSVTDESFLSSEVKRSFCCAATLAGICRRGKHGPSLATKLLKKRRVRTRRRRVARNSQMPKPGDVLVTETLNTETTAQVVWQVRPHRPACRHSTKVRVL